MNPSNFRPFCSYFLTLILLFITAQQPAEAQVRRPKTYFRQSYGWLARNWSVQATAGFGMYFGDLSQYDEDPFNKISHESKPSMGLVVGNKILSFLAVQGRLSYLRYKAENTVFNRRLDGHAYFSGLNLMVDLVNLLAFPDELDPDVYLYITAGLGLIRMRPELSNLESGDPLSSALVQKKAELETYFGVGANKYLSNSWDLTFEISLNKINSDLLDGIRKTNQNDYLVYTSLGVKYNLPDLLSTRKMKYRRGKPILRR